MTRTLIMLGVLPLVMAGIATGPAAAAIRCQGPNQIINGEGLPTPYCEDAYLAQVARGYGVSVTAAAIRASYTRKTRVCELIGHDSRLSNICAGHRPADRRGGKTWF